jgi:hypothetical protein
MNFLLVSLFSMAVLFVGMLLCQELGRRLALRHRRVDPDHEKGTGVAENAVFGVLGLFLAFTFSSAASRFDEKRHFIIDEANAIERAWDRLDVLPTASQPPLRDLFRTYIDTRLLAYRDSHDTRALHAAQAHAVELQEQIWSQAVAATSSAGTPGVTNIVLPALNDMTEVAKTRMAARRMHVPMSIFIVLGMLTLVGAVFGGYGMASRQSRSTLHSVGFAAVMTLALYLILDLEYPRFGFIRLDTTDQILHDLRHSMQ